ncbi:MAG TPA: signal recognition particle protein Srp54 [Candidatus Thermoplasmatota archaeon]|jgi:signal recognition particle subunit SRP54|nr:signal recognition particle protein Srp54 [Candidatus Thermoplasmatota archaeon]
MVLDALGESLRGTLKKIAGAKKIDEALIKEVVRDIQRALLQADVNVKLTLQLTKAIQERALHEEPPKGVSARNHVIKVVHDEMVNILGKPRDIPAKPMKILMVGLYGQGKTTTTGKLAKWYSKKGLKVGLIAADVHRPAAYQQLQQLSQQVKVPFFGDPDAKAGDAERVVKQGLVELRKQKCDMIIVDTSGRHRLEDDLVQEVKDVAAAVQADEKFLVIDATVGQQAGPQAKAFHEAVGLTGVVLTKIDGSAKGGGALSAVAETGAPVVFVGTGEHIEELEKFDPARFISRLLGMGDLQSLLEAAQEAVTDEDKAERTARRILSGKFTLVEMREQMEMLAGMGSMSKLMSMIPGMGGRMSDEAMAETQARLGKFKVIMGSMTRHEMENPNEIKGSRIQRIARGAGVEPREVKDLLKYYEMSKRAVKGFAGNKKMQKRLMSQLQFDESGLPKG